MRPLAFFIFLPITLTAAIDAAAQQATGCDTCEWSQRDDRWEGLFVQEVSGASFELQSLQFLHLPDTPAEGEQLHLSFWLPEPLELDRIEVWQPARLYRMEPVQREYGAGWQEFVWPRGAVIDRLGLSIHALYTRIKEGAVYVPALLSTAAASRSAEGYSFVFHSGAGIDALCTIARRSGTPRVIRRFDCFEDYGGTIVIEWDGRDESGRAVPEGVYVLEIEGDMLAETLRPLRYSAAFWHRGEPGSRPPPAQPRGEPR